MLPWQGAVIPFGSPALPRMAWGRREQDSRACCSPFPVPWSLNDTGCICNWCNWCSTSGLIQPAGQSCHSALGEKPQEMVVIRRALQARPSPGPCSLQSGLFCPGPALAIPLLTSTHQPREGALPCPCSTVAVTMLTACWTPSFERSKAPVLCCSVGSQSTNGLSMGDCRR